MEATTVRQVPPAQGGTGPAAAAKPLADPAPLGLAGFALTTFVLSMYKANLVGAGVPPLARSAVVLGLALAYGGVAQLLAGMWEFRNGNTFGATAFTSYGAFWISFWALVTFYLNDVTGKDIGLYEIGWGIFTAYMWVASLRTSVAVSVVFFLLTITFVLLGIGDAGAHTSITHAGGYVGLATALAAGYASFAGVANSTFGRTVIPTIPLNTR
jgi:hypothetical protein